MPEQQRASRLRDQANRSAEAANSSELCWYAAAVHARQERAAAAALTDRGFEVFLPTRTEPRIWSDRVQNLSVALFPGYLFLRGVMTAARRVEMLRARQVYDLVGRTPGKSGIATPIPDDEIESLKRLTESERELTPADRLVRGAEVLVADGPLRGTRGILLSDPHGEKRLVVQIPLLGRSVRTWLCADDLLEVPVEDP